jgi:transmembrane 9 superfamily protein 2/4
MNYTDLLLKLLTDLLNISLMQGDILQVKVNKLTSTKTQLPYSYYSLPYVAPKKIQDSAENLGEVLRGDRIENSLYVVSFTC